ncbi:MAG: DUF1990 family protein [Chloroflexi bacterium]|nr:MAG: DUF1990 family protein [Chloroflexota bacterium]
MALLTTVTLEWLSDGCCDVKYLDEWEQVPLNYHASIPLDETWHIDKYEASLGHDATGELFACAADVLMRYEFYPPDVLTHMSDFDLQGRWLQVGDRIVQRVHVWQLRGRVVLDAVVMNEVTAVTQADRRCGFTCVTTARHVEQGEWSAYVAWLPDGQVVLRVSSVSRPVPEEPRRNYRFIRARQQQAHRRGLSYFQEVVQARYRERLTAVSS